MQLRVIAIAYGMIALDRRSYMIVDGLKKLGYEYTHGPVERNFKGAVFHAAVQVGSLVYTSGQVPLIDGKEIRGKVGAEIDLVTAQKAAEICAYNCLVAAGSVIDIEKLVRVVKLFGMVNVAPGFDNTSEVINGASQFINILFGAKNGHARTAVGMVLPSNWAVEIDMVFEAK